MYQGGSVPSARLSRFLRAEGWFVSLESDANGHRAGVPTACKSVPMESPSAVGCCWNINRGSAATGQPSSSATFIVAAASMRNTSHVRPSGEAALCLPNLLYDRLWIAYCGALPMIPLHMRQKRQWQSDVVRFYVVDYVRCPTPSSVGKDVR
jgi:hypothetical protein